MRGLDFLPEKGFARTPHFVRSNERGVLFDLSNDCYLTSYTSAVLQTIVTQLVKKLMSMSRNVCGLDPDLLG